jgi:hypothetical protein
LAVRRRLGEYRGVADLFLVGLDLFLVGLAEARFAEGAVFFRIVLLAF